MNFGANVNNKEASITNAYDTNFNAIKLNGVNTVDNRNDINSNEMIRRFEIETMDFDNPDTIVNTVNYKIDNVKLLNGDVICVKSENVDSVINGITNFSEMSMLLDHVKGKGMYTGAVKSFNVQSIIDTAD